MMPERKNHSLLRGGEFRPSTVDMEARTVEVVFTTGQAVRRYNWRENERFLEELDVTSESMRLERLDKGLSTIDNHDTWRGVSNVYGITGAYRFEEGNKLVGTVRFASDPESDTIFKKVAEGVLRHVSLGYKVHQYTVSRGDGDKLPVYRATDWEPTELSFVPVGAETQNGVRSEEDEPFTAEIVERKAIMPKKDESGGGNHPSGAPATVNIVVDDKRGEGLIDPPGTDPGVDPETLRKDAESKARADLLAMKEVSAAAGLSDEFATRAFSDGVDIHKFREMAIEELGKESSDHKIVLKSDGRADAHTQSREDAENAIILRTSASMIDVSSIERTEGVRSYQGLRLLDFARFFLEDSGVQTRGMSPQKIAERAFQTDSDLPLVFENVMNKGLQASFQETPRTFLDLGRRTTVTDFRDKNMYSLGDAPSLLPLGDNGEYKAGKFSEGKESYSIATFARKIGFTRRMLINDDMSALDMMPASFGAAGSRLESDIVWGLILNYDFQKNTAASIVMNDGNPLFHSSHKNLLSAAGSDMSLTGLSNLRKLGRKQKTLDGNHMNLEFTTIVVPSDLETPAEQVLVNNFTAITAGTTNSFTRKMNVRVEPRLDVVSTVEWYAFANYLQMPTFEYAYLSGDEEMMIEVNTKTDIDGMEIKVRKDFGAGLPEYRGMAKAAGIPSA